MVRTWMASFFLSTGTSEFMFVEALAGLGGYAIFGGK